MSAIIDNLRHFDRKERFHLVRQALGDAPLAESFKKTVLQLVPDIGKNPFIAMDYHLDWVFASLCLAAHGRIDVPQRRNPMEISGGPDDVDCLIAYQRANKCHLLMLEAKGVTRFSNKQMAHKAERLGTIFGRDGKRWPHVVPHFIIASPKRPQKLMFNEWPGWMKPKDSLPWVELKISGDWRVVRCDDAGSPKRHGQCWMILEITGSAAAAEIDPILSSALRRGQQAEVFSVRIEETLMRLDAVIK